MNWKTYLAIAAVLACQLHADQDTVAQSHAKTNNLELMYVFNKSYIDNLNYDINIYRQFGGTQRITPDFQWGEQGQITWTKKIPNSIYSIVTSFLALHNHFNYYTQKAPENGFLSINSYNKYVSGLNLNSANPSQVIKYSQHNQFNLYDLDLFVKADLKNTKHAHFSIFGGAIISGYNFKTNQKGTSYDFGGTLSSQKSYVSDTDYFVGPNAKIYVAAPFFNNHLELSLRAGLGFMMSFDSITAYKHTYDAAGALTDSDTKSQSNTFRFAYQYDILAQVAFCYNDFCLASGITQFYYLATKPNNVITYGGPFIKASYTF